MSSKKSFQIYAALLWTINDFPAYDDISGWSTKCALACPLVTMIISLVSLDMEGNLVTFEIGDSWIVIINFASRKIHLMGMLIRD